MILFLSVQVKHLECMEKRQWVQTLLCPRCRFKRFEGGTGVTGREGAKDVPKPPEEVRRSGVWQSALLLKRCEIWHPTVLHIYG